MGDTLQPALPRALYVDPATWETERDVVLHGEWFCVGDPSSARCPTRASRSGRYVASTPSPPTATSLGLGAAHGFKFAPTLGRLIADVALGERPPVDLTPYRLDRPALTDPDYAAHWLV